MPIEATKSGPQESINISSTTSIRPIIEDPLWDNSWRIDSLHCDPGTDFEPAADYRARIRQSRKDSRKGYQKAIIRACTDVGAANVALFESNYAGDAFDYGINYCYVGDVSFTSTPALIKACKIALENVRVLGVDIQVLGMQASALSVNAIVHLWQDPGQFDLRNLDSALHSALVNYFTGTTAGFGYRLDAMAGAMMDLTDSIQAVVFTTPSSDSTIVSGSPPVFPESLTRFFLSSNDISLTFDGPQ